MVRSIIVRQSRRQRPPGYSNDDAEMVATTKSLHGTTGSNDGCCCWFSATTTADHHDDDDEIDALLRHVEHNDDDDMDGEEQQPQQQYRNSSRMMGIKCIAILSLLGLFSYTILLHDDINSDSSHILLYAASMMMTPKTIGIDTATATTETTLPVNHNPFQFHMTSSAFTYGHQIPSKYNTTITPPLHWYQIPIHTESFVLTMDDIDTSKRHWIMYNIPAHIHQLDEGILVLPDGCVVLYNDFGHVRYDGPGATAEHHHHHDHHHDQKQQQHDHQHGILHHYMFHLFALNISSLAVSTDQNAYMTTYHDLQSAMHPYVIKEATLMGTYHHDP